MRLEDNRDRSPVRDDASLTDRGLHLGRVMRVVIEETAGTHLAASLKPASRARELTQSVGDRLRIQATLDTSHPRARSVEHVMLARHAHDQLGAAVPPRQRSGGTTSSTRTSEITTSGVCSARPARP